MRLALAAATVLTVVSGSAWAQSSLEGPACPELIGAFSIQVLPMAAAARAPVSGSHCSLRPAKP